MSNGSNISPLKKRLPLAETASDCAPLSDGELKHFTATDFEDIYPVLELARAVLAGMMATGDVQRVSCAVNSVLDVMSKEAEHV